jgi:predicted CoA-binding protein
MSEERSVPDIIDDFLAEGPYAVVGASTDRSKYGNKVFRAYLQSGRKAFPVNPKADEVEGKPAYADLASLPETPRGISIITPPPVTEKVVEHAAEAGVKFVWMQPGAESPEAIRKARELGLEVIGDGSCLLVVVGYRE